jgi:hypothetical protein
MKLYLPSRITPLRAEDALRKIRLLSSVRTENGALAAEAENATRLVKALMERYEIPAEDLPGAPRKPSPRLTWVYWEELLNEFGLQLRRFGSRGNAAIGHDRIVYIKLGTTQWWIEQKSKDGRQTTARDWGVETLRRYLNEHARRYSFFRS